MGIQGLLPFLKKIHTPVNVSQFQGCTVAIDAYCWLHKGAFSCAEKLALGEKTEQYVYYCMKYVDYLIRNGLKPILVFDGCHLPSKKGVETSRRERREVNRKRAAQLLREGKRAEARECLQRCVDITPQMALQLMNVCRARGVDCIVAPYEADAQLAYLNKAGIAQIIITEDSDLLLFGCDKIIFKMDFFGNGVLIEQSRLNEVVDIPDGFYTFDKFRYMCILSGCDYLPSLTGIGLVKACKVFKLARQTDVKQLLKKLPTYLKMNLVVTDDYIEGFIRANNTFLYQLVFDPRMQKLCPLTPYSPEVDVEELVYAGPYFSDERALQIALGNVDIHTHEKIAGFNPETYMPKYAKKQENELLHMLSIWNPTYRPRSKASTGCTASDKTTPSRPCLAGKEVEVKNVLTRRTPVKRVLAVEDSSDVKTNTELTQLYAATEPKKRKIDANENNHHSDRKKDISLFDTDEEAGVKENSSKKILSPSKLANQEHGRSMSTNEAFFRMEQETTEEITRVEKENRKATRNRFAVSALAKRTKFSLDSPASPNTLVEVKSRYFASAASSPSSAASVASNTATEQINKLWTDEGQSKTSPSSQNVSAGLHSEPRSNQTAEEADSSTRVSSSKTSGSGDRSGNATESIRENRRTQPTGSARKSAGVERTKSAPSPGSAFVWSTFRYTKSSSNQHSVSSSLPLSAGSNKPFKRVMSEDTAGKETSRSSQGQDSLQDNSDSRKADCDDSDSVTCSGGGHSDPKESSPPEKGGDGGNWSDVCSSQRSSSNASDVDASQHSNLYSIDSDCFPTSQDFVDFTEYETDSPSTKSSSLESRKFTSPASTSQISLKSPKSTPKSTSGIKKCRVSGLSRGQKKSLPGADEKQQKIRDMFSRFCRQKGNNLKTGVLGCAEKEADGAPAASAQGPLTPSDPMLAFPTQTHRQLLLS